MCYPAFGVWFAFAIWDSARKRLFLARDRFGKKPLFLMNLGEGCYLLPKLNRFVYPGVSTSVNKEAIWDYLAYRYIPAPATLFSGIRKLMPGSVLVWEQGKIIEKSYYQPPDRFPLKDAELIDDPVGAYLAKTR